MRRVTLILVSVLLTADLFAAGCGPEGPAADGGGDADGEGDADGDVDGDADADGAADADADGPGDADGDGGAPFALDPERVMVDVAFLASDEMGGRAPGSPGNLAALAHVEALFSSLGLEPAGTDGFRQPFDYPEWSVSGPASVALDGVALAAGTGFELFDHSGSGVVEAEVVFAGHGLTVPPFDPAEYPDCPFDPATGYDDYAGLDAAGRVVLVLRHGPRDDEAGYSGCPANEACLAPPCLWTFGYKAANARGHGAAALLVVQDYRHGPDAEAGLGLTADYYAPEFPAFFLDRAAVETAVPDLRAWADAIDETLAPSSAETGVTASLSAATEVRTVPTENLLAALPGRDPALGDEVVVVGAHVDHLGTDLLTGAIYNGADDNASGTAVVMELARAAVGFGLEPARTLLFAAWNAEEAGLLGSCHYVAAPTRPLADTVAVLNLDMVGAGDGSGLRLYGGDDPANRWLGDLMEATAADDGLDLLLVRSPQAYVSDHACFVRQGVPALYLESLGPHATYHTPADRPETIDLDDLGSSLRLAWAGLRPLALGAEAN